MEGKRKDGGEVHERPLVLVLNNTLGMEIAMSVPSLPYIHITQGLGERGMVKEMGEKER